MPGEEEATLVKQAIEPIETKEDKIKQNKSDVSQQMQQSIMRSHSEDSLKNKVDLADSIVNDDSNEQKQEEEEEIKLIPQDFFYDESHKEKIHDQSPIPECVVEMDAFFGYDSFKRYNPKILDRDNIIFSSGISYTIFNHFTKDQQRFYSLEKGGIGCIAVSHNKKYFAVGEMGSWPNVYIYEYPSLKLYRILRKGTQRTYSSICFSNDDNLLVTVGGDPDFLITVWEWKQERLMLKSKAFSQDIYRVTFSQFNQNLLTTSGTGHIRFWKIAQTFTGLKLQGDIAKFGQFELSDVVSYAEFEDGNVLSSSEYGKLLLWQGNLIKSVVSIDQNTPCHKGSIEYVRLMGKEIITCGSDGYIKFWDYEQINNGESDEHFNLFVKPKKQFYFQSSPGKPAYLNWIQIGDDFWLVQDALGTLYKFKVSEDKRESIKKFNAGRFTDVALSPLNNCCITTGYDGQVRLFDYGNKRMFYSRKFATTAESTCIEWLPFSKKNAGRMVVVGFSDGIVRFLGLQQYTFKLIKADKVHKNPILKIKANREGSVVAVCDTQGSIFLLDLHPSQLQNITPYCLFQTGFKINDMSFDKLGQKLLLACNDGRLHELEVPKISQCTFDQSYLHTPKYRSFTIKMMESQKPKRQDLQLELLLKKTKGGNVDDVIVDEEWQPAPILNATYYDPECTKILCSVDGKYLGNYYIVDMTKERPVSSLQCTKTSKTSYMSYNENTDMILIGYKNGSWEIRHKYNPNIYMKKQSFDQNYGIVRKVAINLENTAILALSEDATMISYKIDFGSFLKGAKGDDVQPVQISMPPMILGISEATFADKIQFTTEEQKDITDNSKFCLQQQKLKKEESQKMSEAEKTKLKKRKKILDLQKLYKEVVESNEAETDYLAKLKPEELVIDEEYQQMLQDKVKQEIEQTKKVMMWDEYKADLAKKKIEKYFFDELQYDNFSVKGIRSDTVVSSFKLQKLSPYVQKELQEIEKIIRDQQASERRNTKNDKTISQFQQSKAMMEINKLKQTKKGVGKEENQEVRNKIREAEQQFQKQLEHAQSTMGDYKLKSASDYAVPENERLNVSRKKKHLFLHYQYLFLEKQEFNRRLDGLRLRKRDMVSNLDNINQRLRQINKQLETEEKDILFTIDEDIELLETQFDITDEDINEHLIQKQKEKDAAKKGSGGMGMGSNNDTKEEKTDQVIKKPRKKKIVEKKQDKSQQNQIIVPPRKNMKTRKTPLEDEYREIKRIQLQAQKERIHKQINRQIQSFDKELRQLRIYKYQLQNDLNLVQMKLLTYTQEFLIFRDMETYDNQLMTSIKNYSTEKQSLQSTFINLSSEINDIEVINEELKKKFEDEKKILKEFVYPEDDEMRERIIRYYKIRERKRIQKLKKQQQIEEKQKESDEDQDEEDEQESEEESEEEDEFDDEDEEKPDINIIENDHKNFERVRKICEYDQKIQQNQRRKSDLQKQRNQVSNKIKTIDNELLKSEKQLKIYQKKKLLKINQLFVSLPIKTSQVEYLVNINNKGRMPEDFTNAILFQKETFAKLGDRIEELKREKVDIEKKQRNLNKKLSKLTEEVAKASNEIESKRKDYEEKQLLKFGSTFQLDKLKELEPTDQVLDMRALYKKQQRQVSNRIQQIKQQLQERKRQLLEAKRQNTRVITQITELGNKETQLKKKLDSTNKQLFKNYDVSKKDELQKERQNLKDLIKFLSKEIQDLKTEIGLFKRKGGHIYTMVTSNKKNFS